MGIITRALIRKQAPIPYASRGMVLTQGFQSNTSKESFLKAYCEISWLRAAVSIIAQAVAETTWRLYTIDKTGDREELSKPHELTAMLDRPNPWQTGHDLLEMHQLFQELTGATYWVKERNLGKRELWLAPTQYMSAIPHPTEYVSGYRFEREGFVKNFQPDEVIPFLLPNPNDMYSGSAPVQAVGMNIDILNFALQWNRNFFYWGADPGTVITFPVDANIPEDELKRMQEQWAAGHRSYGRAHKTAFMSHGAKIERLTMGQKDMDFVALLKDNRDVILANWGLSYSILGGTEHVNRATAEAEQCNFAAKVIHPRLVRIREKLNEFLCPDYGENLELDFDNVIPEDKVALLAEAGDGLRSGAITVNEYRQHLGWDPTDDGDVYLRPFSVTVVPLGMGDEVPEPPPPEVLPPEIETDEELNKGNGHKPLLKTMPNAEYYWKVYVKQAEAWEPKAKAQLREMWGAQETEALSNLKQSVDRNAQLIDVDKSKSEYARLMQPLGGLVIMEGMKRGAELIAPKNPHKQIPEILSEYALQWLKMRIVWAALETTNETEKLLRQALIDGYAAGESMDVIAKRVKTVFAYNDSVRAERIARTEILAASNTGAEEGYRLEGVKKTEIWAALDERLCPLCDSLHGTVHDIEEHFTPPFHVNCRCTVLPWLEV